MKKRVAILGSTGSVGITALKVIASLSDKFEIDSLACGKNRKLLEEQIEKFRPVSAAILNKYDAEIISKKFKEVKVFGGDDSACSLMDECNADIIIAAITGGAGLLPTYKAISKGKRVAIANKEALVMAGFIINNEAKLKGTEIIPVDSEHSAIFQCLLGQDYNAINRIILTASGGALRDWPAESLKRATIEDALNHPNWSMGKKITIDSATMMNKGLEVIEAHHLFHLSAEHINVIIHPESIIHSMVEFIDGSVIAQLATPDMALPVQFAMTYPKRLKTDIKPVRFSDLKKMTFREVSHERHQCLFLAYEALNAGQRACIALNAANEEAVNAFLHKSISFADIPAIIKETLNSCKCQDPITIDDVLKQDIASRMKAKTIIKELK